MKHNKPIAPDRHDIHVLLDLIGGYGVAVAVGIIAMLSVCAAFFIYRSVRGQRGKACENNGSETTAATTEDGRERGDQSTDTESTGKTGQLLNRRHYRVTVTIRRSKSKRQSLSYFSHNKNTMM